MLLNFKNLKKLPVETASGIKLGHIADIILEIDGQLVAQYLVKHSIISGKEYLISRDQIIRFEDNPSTSFDYAQDKSLRINKIIVDDNVEKAENKIQTKESNISPEPISMRKSA